MVVLHLSTRVVYFPAIQAVLPCRPVLKNGLTGPTGCRCFVCNSFEIFPAFAPELLESISQTKK